MGHLLFNNKKEWSTDKCYSMDEPHMLLSKWKKPNKKTTVSAYDDSQAWWFTRKTHRNQKLLCSWLWITTAKGCRLKSAKRKGTWGGRKSGRPRFKLQVYSLVTSHGVHLILIATVCDNTCAANQECWHKPWYPGFFLGVSHIGFSYSDFSPQEK